MSKPVFGRGARRKRRRPRVVPPRAARGDWPRVLTFTPVDLGGGWTWWRQL